MADILETHSRIKADYFDLSNPHIETDVLVIGDGLILAYRAGAKLLYMDSVQYHPTGAVFPEQVRKSRVNARGDDAIG